MAASRVADRATPNPERPPPGVAVLVALAWLVPLLLTEACALLPAPPARADERDAAIVGRPGRAVTAYRRTSMRRVLPAESDTAHSSKRGARVAGFTFFETPQPSVGTPNQFVSSFPLSLASSTTATA